MAINRMDRNTLIEQMVDRSWDSMDERQMYMLFVEVMTDRYNSYSDEELEAEAEENYPDLLEDE